MEEVLLQKKLTDEIFTVTARIQKEFPALYQNLSETPLFLPPQETQLNIDDFRKYLESLKAQLADFEKADLAKKNQLL